MKTYIIILCISFGIVTNLFASGFQINEQGSRAMGLGGAFTGLANDPSAIYFNPGGITQLNGTHILAGATLILPTSTFRGPAPSITESKMKSQAFYPIHFYATHHLGENLYLGLGVGNNFGLGTKWNTDWVGRYMAVETEIRTFFFNFVAAYKIMDEVSVGFGYVLAYGDVLIGRKLNLSPFDAESYLELQGNGYGSGFTAGLFIHPIKAISLGVSFRSQVKIDFDGDATPSDYPSQFEGQLPNGSITAPLTTPLNFTFGFAIMPNKNLTVSADYQYVGWDSYDKLEIQFNDFIDPVTNKPLISSSDRMYDNSFIARIGAEYKYSGNFTGRIGFLYDKNPVPDERLDPTLPDADRLGFNVGGSYKLSQNLSIEAAYMFLRFDERKIKNSLENYSGIDGSISPMNGVYNSIAHLTSITLAYNF